METPLQLTHRLNPAGPSRAVAVGLRALVVVFALAFLAAYGLGWHLGLRSGDLNPALFTTPVIVVVPFVLGWLIERKHPGHRIALLFLLMAYASAVTTIVGVTGEYFAEPLRASWPALHSVGLVIGHSLWLPGLFIPLFIMPLYFPDGKLLSPRWRVVVAAVLLSMVVYVAAVALHPWPWPSFGILDARAYNGIAGSERILEVAVSAANDLLIMVFLMNLLAVVLRYRRAEPAERKQIRWPIVAVGFVLVVQVLKSLVPGMTALEERTDYFLTWTVAMLFPVAIGLAILQYRLWDIDVIIRRALIYGGLTVIIVSIYVAVVTGVGLIFQTQTSAIGGLIAAGLIAVLFQPLRQNLQKSVNRLLYGQRDDPAAVLTQLAQQAETAEGPDAILPALAETVGRLLKVPYVAIQRPGEDGQTAAVWGVADVPIESVPITYQQQAIGRLDVARRTPLEAFTVQEKQLLASIAALTATTIHSVQLADDLRRSRQRIVGAREDERRRLRRDLHDGLGPQLASQTLALEAVSQLMTRDPEKAQAILESLKGQAEDAVRDVRRLVYDLRPPALDDLGLIGALRQTAGRYQTGSLRFAFDVPEWLPELPAAVETAAFRIAQEAMTNVVRHARATNCTVRLECTGAQMRLEVEDNGCGLPEQHRTGVGLLAMQERTAELNGSLVVRAIPSGGTLVRAMLPGHFTPDSHKQG